MPYRNSWIILALVAIMALTLISLNEVQAEGNSNGDPMPTTLFMAGSGDDLTLWAKGPDDSAEGSTRSVMVSETVTQGYVDVGTWETTAPLDKDLHIEEDTTINVILFINSTDNSGPRVRFEITMFGETHETDYYGTNPGISKLEIEYTVSAWEGVENETITMGIRVDAQDSIEPADKEINLHFWHESTDARIEFESDATDINIETEIEEDNQGVKYYKIYVNITDAFGGEHIEKSSFILNITSVDDPTNYTAEDRRDGNESEYIHYVGGQYWGTLGYTAIEYKWYYEGREYSNDVEGQGVEPGDFWMDFDMEDAEGNPRFYDHLQTGVSPIHVHVNIHSDDEYISVVDVRNKDVDEVAAHDDVRVRVWIEVNKGRRGHLYEFYVEFRQDGSLVEGGRKFIQVEGKSGEYLYFDWDPLKGDHTLNIECDSDNDISEIDESDNDISKEVTVIAEAAPQIIISNPTEGQYINSDVFILFDAFNTTNPISGDMTFSWTIAKWDGNDFVTKTQLSGDRVLAPKLYANSYGAGKYQVTLEVENDKRVSAEEVEFFINMIPEIILDSPTDGDVFNANEPITFDASASEDEDGDDLFFLWISNKAGVLNKDGSTIEYGWDSFPKDLSGGIHEITLEVYDYDPADPPEDGRRGIAFEYFTITVNTPPVIEILEPLNGSSHSEKADIMFHGDRSYDPDGDVISFRWTDGNQFLSDEAIFNETLSSGEHAITLEVSDDVSSTVKVIFITVGSPPVATTSDSKTVTLKDGKAKAKLDASDSTPSDDSVPLEKYIWDRDSNVDSDGDGDPANDEDYEETNPVVELEYNKTGTYTAILWVEDESGVRSQPFQIKVTVNKEESDDDFPIAIAGVVVAAIAIGLVAVFIFIQNRDYDDYDDEDDDDEEYEAEYDEGEYEAEYY